MQKIPYVSAVGILMYAQVCTRSDIAFIVEVLSRYLNNPGMDSWKIVKKDGRYLKRTKYYMLTYRRLNQLDITGYYDSDFGGCQDSKRATSGYIYMLAGGAVSWCSAKQTLTALSTTTAKLITCYEASNHVIWLMNLITRLRIMEEIERPLKLYCDNKSVILYSTIIGARPSQNILISSS
ncbi:secreted RxLR effector protein 161-like [Vicia villosa]|uniref:secreted RxLR effector protein 161-like n=1 Tax=Vicia villosa TaxID=3911 RepID=UPI00273A9F31|nr:secreted RxLR effector protein 161-like [Vicia villosa]